MQKISKRARILKWRLNKWAEMARYEWKVRGMPGFLSGLFVNVENSRRAKVASGACMMNDGSIVKISDPIWSKESIGDQYRWYFVYLIARPVRRWQWILFWQKPVDVLISEKPEPTLPKGFTRFRRIGTVSPKKAQAMRYGENPFTVEVIS